MEKIKLTQDITDEILEKVRVYVKEKMTTTAASAECATICATIESHAREIADDLIARRDKFRSTWHAVASKHLYIKKRNDKYVVEPENTTPYSTVCVDLSNYIYIPYNDSSCFKYRFDSVLGQTYLENAINSLEIFNKAWLRILDSYSSIIYSYRFVHTLLADHPEFVSFMPDYISEKIYVSPKIQASKVIRLFESGELHKIAV